jgi:hypothetical protein
MSSDEIMQEPASGESTHASRNPGKQVQETRGRKKGPLTDSQKATRATTAQNRKLAKALLDQDLDKFHAMRTKSIHDMSKAHNRTPEYIKRLVMSESCIKTTRSMTLRNALMHDFSAKARAGTFLPCLPSISVIDHPFRGTSRAIADGTPPTRRFCAAGEEDRAGGDGPV